jgi:hypothetical protein
MADTGKMIGLVALIGGGGFIVYEYMQYNNALNIINQRDPTQQTSNTIQLIFPFTSWLGAAFGAPAAGTPQGNMYQLLMAALEGKLSSIMPAATTSTVTPGTSASGPAVTTVSTAPTTTTPAPPAPPSSPQPTAQDLQNALNLQVASPDQWNFAYRQLTGYGIEQIFGGNFDSIYGSIGANGQRPAGNISAQAFLNMPVALGISAGALHGIGRMGAIAQFYTPVVNSMASMVYRAQHPSPYRLPMGGSLGALTQATGFEKALWSGGFIRSRRVR